jgi:hypothetical protein
MDELMELLYSGWLDANTRVVEPIQLLFSCKSHSAVTQLLVCVASYFNYRRKLPLCVTPANMSLGYSALRLVL